MDFLYYISSQVHNWEELGAHGVNASNSVCARIPEHYGTRTERARGCHVHVHQCVTATTSKPNYDVYSRIKQAESAAQAQAQRPPPWAVQIRWHAHPGYQPPPHHPTSSAWRRRSLNSGVDQVLVDHDTSCSKVSRAPSPSRAGGREVRH